MSTGRLCHGDLWKDYDGRQQVVYFAYCWEFGLVKIGVSSRPHQRVRSMATSCPAVLDLAYVYDPQVPEVEWRERGRLYRYERYLTPARIAEQLLHERLADAHKINEWFYAPSHSFEWVMSQVQAVHGETWSRYEQQVGAVA